MLVTINELPSTWKIHPPLPFSPHSLFAHTFTEAVVLFDYEKQQDDELSLKVEDVITDVKQVCIWSFQA